MAVDYRYTVIDGKGYRVRNADGKYPIVEVLVPMRAWPPRIAHYRIVPVGEAKLKRIMANLTAKSVNA